MNFKGVSEFLYNGGGENGPYRGCVVYKNGELLYRYVCGMGRASEGKKATGEELCWIFSCTKVMTVVATMILVEKGKLSLEDRLSDYIPEYKIMKLVDGSIAKKPILIKHLLAMASGVDYGLNNTDIQYMREKTQGKFPTYETVKAFAARPLLFESGDGFYYGLSHDILAALIGKITNTGYYEFIKENILAPLNMNNTFMHKTAEIEERMMDMCSYSEEKGFIFGKPINNFVFGSEYECGGAGIITCLDDYGRFANMLAMGGKAPDGRTIISKESIDFIRTPALDDNFQKSFAINGWKEDKGCHYGYGVYTVVNREMPKTKASLHSFGWDGAAGSYISVDPDQRVAIFYMQQLPGKHLVEHFDLREKIYDALDE